MTRSSVLTLCCFFTAIVLVVADVPQTLQRFSADFQQSLSIGAQLGVSSETVKRHLDQLHLSSYKAAVDDFDRQRPELQKRGADVATLAISAIAKGSGQFDIKNNLLLQSINDLYFDFSGIVQIDLKHVEATSLVMFDLAKNYTWNGDVCLCQDIQGPQEMPLFYVPPYATVEGNTNITINDETVPVTEYSAEFKVQFNFPSLLPPYISFSPPPTSTTEEVENQKSEEEVGADGLIGDLFSMTYYIYVDQSEVVRRVVFNVQLGIPGFNTFVNSTTDFWNVVELNDTQLVIPDDKCYNVCKAAVDTIENYASCLLPTGNCQCPLASNISFCGDIVKYPICKTIFMVEADLYVNTTFGSLQASISAQGEVSVECLNELKEFLCKFYFPSCSSSGDYVKPDINSTLSCWVGNSTTKRGTQPTDQQKATVMNSAAMSAYETAAGRTRSYSSNVPGALLAWQIALIVIGAVLFVAIVVIVIVFAVRSKRANYQSM